jgi:hypothetical protein
LCCIGLLSVAVEAARADVVIITSPGQMQTNGVINFGLFGAEGTFVANGSMVPITGLPGQDVKVFGNIDGGFLRVDQGGLWAGGFPNGDPLLSTAVDPGSHIDKSAAIDFINGPIGAIGLFIQMDPARGLDPFGPGPSFTAFLTATDINHEVFHAAGSVFSPDGSPVFIGARDNGSTFPPFAAIEIHVEDAFGFKWDFAFDPIVQALPGPGPAGGATPVPEPSSLILCTVFGVAGVVARVRRRRTELADSAV